MCPPAVLADLPVLGEPAERPALEPAAGATPKYSSKRPFEYSSLEKFMHQFSQKWYRCSRTHAAFLNPARHFFISDVLAAGMLEELVCLFLLQLHIAVALLIQLLVALPQLKQGFAAFQALCNLLQ